MANWYRHPKSLNLRWLILDSQFSFVLNASQFSDDEFRQLRASLVAVGYPQRIRLGTTLAGNGTSILVVSSNGVREENLKSLLSYGWRGLIIVPPGAPERQMTLVDLFTRRSHFKFGDRNRRIFNSRDLPPFLLDLTVGAGLIFTTPLTRLRRDVTSDQRNDIGTAATINCSTDTPTAEKMDKHV